MVGDSDMPQLAAFPPPMSAAASAPSSRGSPGSDGDDAPPPRHHEERQQGFGLRVPGTQVSSRYRGVSWCASTGAWQAVTWDADAKRPRTLGAFATEEDVRLAWAPPRIILC